MRACRYCEAVDSGVGRKCRNCGAAYRTDSEPEPRKGPLAGFEAFVGATGAAALKAEARAETDHFQGPHETYERMYRILLERKRHGIIYPTREEN